MADTPPEEMSDEELASEAKGIDRVFRAPVSDGSLHIDEVAEEIRERTRLMKRQVALLVELQRRAPAPGLVKLSEDASVKLRADEVTPAGDRFRFQTFRMKGSAITFKAGRSTRTEPKTFTIFIPRSASPDQNKVHVFFTPDPYNEAAFVADQGLRLQHEGSSWILVAVLGSFETWTPNYVTISTREIQDCLSLAKRASTTIHALRLSAPVGGAAGSRPRWATARGPRPSTSRSSSA